MNLEYTIGMAVGLLILLAIVIFFARASQKTKKHDVHIPVDGLDEEGRPTKTDSTKTAAIEERAVDAPKTLNEALQNTKKSFLGRIQSSLSGKTQIGDEEIEEIEEVLYTSDIGPKTVQKLMICIQELVDEGEVTGDKVRDALRKEMNSVFEDTKESSELLASLQKGDLKIWMVVGVNGAGKTTTIGKLAHQAANQGLKTMIAAGDTFRAAAKEQLAVWSERAKVEIFAPENISNPSGLAFDAVKKAQNDGFDLLIIDTAGRLHTQKNLMEELEKVKRVVNKAKEGAPDEVLLVLDSNQGQNALVQANQFHQSLEVTGVVLTKLDGTAKGGVALGVAYELKLPIRLIGVGEKIEDLRNFSSKEFVESIF